MKKIIQFFIPQFSFCKFKEILFLFSLLIFLVSFITGGEQEIEEIKKRLDELKGRELGALEEIEKIDFEIILKEREIEDLKTKEKLLSDLLKKKEKELNKVKEEYERERERLKNLFSVIYMFRYFNPLEIFLTKNKNLTFTDISRIIYISNLSKEKINQIELIKKRLIEGEKELKRIKEDYHKAIKVKENRLMELNDKKKGKKKLIEELRIEKDRYFALLKEIEMASKEISKTISSSEPTKFPVDTVSIRERKGELPWPVEGKLIQQFGLVKNKKYNTFVKNIGVVFSPRGEEVKAIWWGKVIFADYFEGYGNVVIIEHQERVYSIYGYLGTILAKKGEQVNTGQIIAKIGSSGLASDGALYFEIREGNEPKNPLIWLSKK